MKKEIEALKAAATATANEKTVLENKIKELEGVNKTTLETINKVKSDFDEFKKLVPGDPKNKDPKQIEKIEKEAWDKMSNTERMYHARHAKQSVFHPIPMLASFMQSTHGLQYCLLPDW